MRAGQGSGVESGGEQIFTTFCDRTSTSDFCPPGSELFCDDSNWSLLLVEASNFFLRHLLRSLSSFRLCPALTRKVKKRNNLFEELFT